MLQYVNGFSCAMNNEKGEFIINFMQRYPKIEEDGVMDETVVENVSSIIMDISVAEKLLDALRELVETDCMEDNSGENS